MADNLKTRRDASGAAGVLTGVFGLDLSLAGASLGESATTTDAEKENLDLINAFCAAWIAKDLVAIMNYFSHNPAFRLDELQAPVVGRQAVMDWFGPVLKNVVRLEVHDSWARGPFVINKRTDHFTGRIKSWQGFGVFLIKEAKIVEWYDHTTALQLA
jgi:limonene-1,2-epoxide hydrolase